MLYIFNTTIIPNAGLYEVTKITKTKARELVKNDFRSAIGHKATAEFLTETLNKKIPVSRTNPRLLKGDMTLCFKIRKRPPEGKVLSLKSLRNIKYNFYLIERVDL